MFFPKLPWRLLPAHGGVPTPGKDCVPNPQEEWIALAQKNEAVLFFVDAETKRLLTAEGKPAEESSVKYCVAFRSRFYAELVARRTTAKHHHMQCAMYDSSGRWIETYTLGGVERRNNFRRLVTRVATYASAIVGFCVAIMTVSAISPASFGGDRIRWTSLSTTMKSGLLVAGVLCTILSVVIYNAFRKALYKWAVWPSKGQLGSRRREYFYKQLAARSPAFLAPTEITLEPRHIIWPSQEKYDEWLMSLERNGFHRLGSFASTQVNLQLEFWLNDSESLCAEIVNRREGEMWLSVTTYYENGDCFCVVNKDPGVIEPRPGDLISYVGWQSTAQEVIEQARLKRSSVPRKHLDSTTLIDHYRGRWRESVLWHRSQGLTTEQRKLIGSRHRARKQSAATQ